jgi:hypothetical protein
MDVAGMATELGLGSQAGTFRGDQTIKNPNRERLRFCKWWRRRESNPRPQVLRPEVYMLIPSLISLAATRRAWKTVSQFS